MRLLPVLAVLMLFGCERSAGRQSDLAPSDTAATTHQGRPAAAWPADDAARIDLRRERQQDMTGDGAGEAFIVTAQGTRYDSLDITLVVVDAAGDTLWLDRWNSRHYFKYIARDGMSSTDAVRLVQAHVDSLLHDSRFSRSGVPPALRGTATPGMANEAIRYHLAEIDWRRGADLEPRDQTPPHAHDRISVREVSEDRVGAVRRELEAGPVFMYYAGGEVTYAIGWSERETAFVRLFSCC